MNHPNAGGEYAFWPFRQGHPDCAGNYSCHLSCSALSWQYCAQSSRRYADNTAFALSPHGLDLTQWGPQVLSSKNRTKSAEGCPQDLRARDRDLMAGHILCPCRTRRSFCKKIALLHHNRPLQQLAAIRHALLSHLGVKHNYRAQDLSGLHVGKAFVDFRELYARRNPIVQMQPPLQVVFH